MFSCVIYQQKQVPSWQRQGTCGIHNLYEVKGNEYSIHKTLQQNQQKNIS